MLVVDTDSSKLKARRKWRLPECKRKGYIDNVDVVAGTGGGDTVSL